MDQAIVVMIVTLALPTGEQSISIKPMLDLTACKSAARIEVTDPFVFKVECSALRDGRLELNFDKLKARKIPQTAFEKSTG